jgi:F-type H+-transporting ATPase subunit epsilon
MPDGDLFELQLVTPERILLTGKATEVVLRTGEGDATFLAGHTPLVGTVEPGVVRVVREDGQVERVASHGGFVQVEYGVELESGPGESGPGGGEAERGTRVTFLLGIAELAEEIDVDRARTALAAAESRVAELSGAGRSAGEGAEADPEVSEAEAELLRAQTRLAAVEEPSPAGT